MGQGGVKGAPNPDENQLHGDYIFPDNCDLSKIHNLDSIKEARKGCNGLEIVKALYNLLEDALDKQKLLIRDGSYEKSFNLYKHWTDEIIFKAYYDWLTKHMRKGGNIRYLTKALSNVTIWASFGCPTKISRYLCNTRDNWIRKDSDFTIKNQTKFFEGMGK